MITYNISKIYVFKSFQNPYKQLISKQNMRDTIGNYPYDTTKVNGKTVLKFYPKGENLKHPDSPKFSITLDKEDLKKLAKIA